MVNKVVTDKTRRERALNASKNGKASSLTFRKCFGPYGQTRDVSTLKKRSQCIQRFEREKSESWRNYATATQADIIPSVAVLK